MSEEPLSFEHLSLPAMFIDGVPASVGHEMAVATELIDDTVPGYSNLLDPTTAPAESR